MSFEQDIRLAKERLTQAEELRNRIKKSLVTIEQMCRTAKYQLADLEKKAEDAKFVDVKPFVCAIQYESHHSYSDKPPKIETIYECRGKHVYVQGTTTPISKTVLARHGHFGSGHRLGNYDRKPIVELVKAHFLDYLQGKHTETPKPLEFRVSYCGN
jgi:hypothetical protein